MPTTPHNVSAVQITAAATLLRISRLMWFGICTVSLPFDKTVVRVARSWLVATDFIPSGCRITAHDRIEPDGSCAARSRNLAQPHGSIASTALQNLRGPYSATLRAFPSFGFRTTHSLKSSPDEITLNGPRTPQENFSAVASARFTQYAGRPVYCW